MILVDNMSPADVRESVRRAAGRASVEISGGVDARAAAGTRHDRGASSCRLVPSRTQRRLSTSASNRTLLTPAVPDRPQPLPTEFEEALAAVRSELAPFGAPLLYFDTVGSTNDVARRWSVPGRGRRHRHRRPADGRARPPRAHVVLPPSAGLYVSVVLAPSRARVEPERATALLTLTAGVALVEAVNA